MKEARRILAWVIVLLTFSATQAAALWSNPSGSTDYFDWQNGQCLYGLFGDPMLVGGNTLVFFPSNFRAESIDGQTGFVSDSLEFELIAHPGFSFQSISITEYGDYGILGDGRVQVSGELSLENLDTDESLNNGLAATPAMPVISGQGTWQAWTQLDIDPLDWTRIKITLQNDLLAVSGFGSAAWIEKKVLGQTVAIQIIPEPATIATLSIGAILIFMLRNLRTKKTVI
jgi:hypothetical protein